MTPSRCVLAIAVGLLVSGPALAFEAFLGRYVGSAELADLKDDAVEERDVGTDIEPYGEGGFKVTWESVIRVDGRRDVPGVRRVVRSFGFEPVDAGAYFVQAPDYDPFKLREDVEPMAGDALAWASVDGDVLDIWVAALQEDGEAELQHHRRTLTGSGLELTFAAYAAGEVLSRGTGRMDKVD